MAAPHSPPESPPQQVQNLLPDLDVPYSAAFTNDLMHTVNEPPTEKTGTAIYNPALLRGSGGNESTVKLDEIDTARIPDVDAADLPLPLDDPRRVYESNVPGVRLTHPGGSLHGGTSTSVPAAHSKDASAVAEDVEEYAMSLIRSNGLRNATLLKKLIAGETARSNEELGRRMRERQEAVEHNERVDKEIQQLQAQREMERRLEERMRDNFQKRRESA